MMGMRWTNWIGFLMLVMFLFIHEPIYLALMDDNGNFFLWVFSLSVYVIVAALLLIWGGPPRVARANPFSRQRQ